MTWNEILRPALLWYDDPQQPLGSHNIPLHVHVTSHQITQDPNALRDATIKLLNLMLHDVMWNDDGHDYARKYVFLC